MPGAKRIPKQVQATERRRLGNKSIRTQCKTNIIRAEKLIATGELKAAQEAVAVAIRSLDRAAEKGIVATNNAARRKSRLMAKLNKAQAPKT